MAVKMNLRMIKRNHATDQEKGFLTKSISKFNGCATAMPTAWELRFVIEKNNILYLAEFLSKLTHLDRLIRLLRYSYLRVDNF